jgi:hypothetical protein
MKFASRPQPTIRNLSNYNNRLGNLAAYTVIVKHNI